MEEVYLVTAIDGEALDLRMRKVFTNRDDAVKHFIHIMEQLGQSEKYAREVADGDGYYCDTTHFSAIIEKVKVC